MKEKTILFNLSEFIYKLKLVHNIPIKYLNLNSVSKIIKDIETVLYSGYDVDVVTTYISNQYDDYPSHQNILVTKTAERDYGDFLNLLINVYNVLRSFPPSNSIITRIQIFIVKERLVMNLNKIIRRYSPSKYLEIEDPINDYLNTEFSMFTIEIIEK